MHNAPPFPIILIAVILCFLFARKKSDPEEKRRSELAVLAKKLQLQFNPNGDFELPNKFSFLSWLNRGIARYAYNIFHGYYQSYPITFFDYNFSAGKCSFYWSAYVLEMKTNFPDLLVSHETKESRIAEALGESHISFESAEFSRTFRVRSSDKKFAFEICHAQMMGYLLANPDLTIEISGKGLAVLFEDWLRPEKVEHNLSRLVEIRKLLPDYLFEKSKR